GALGPPCPGKWARGGRGLRKIRNFKGIIAFSQEYHRAWPPAAIVNNNENTIGPPRNPPDGGSMSASNIKHLPASAPTTSRARNNEITRPEAMRQQYGTRGHGTRRNIAGVSCFIITDHCLQIVADSGD